MSSPHDSVPASSPYASLKALLDGRYSCRSYTPEAVPRDIVEQVLVAAQRTASWCNSQPWQVHIVSGAALERLRGEMYAQRDRPGVPDLDWPREYLGVYRQRRRECGWSLYEAVGIARGDRAASARQAAENFRMFGAPHLAVVTSEKALGTYGAIDCGAYVANFLLAAQSLGLGCVPQAALAGHADVLRAQLPIGDDRSVVCGISFGWPDPTNPVNRWRTSRADAAQAVSWHDH
ncbi:MAG: nitroreductase [Comamonadaceae bacterium]|nr:MAG: nitroreductase [Comamonadaceae bacterium]